MSILYSGRHAAAGAQRTIFLRAERLLASQTVQTGVHSAQCGYTRAMHDADQKQGL